MYNSIIIIAVLLFFMWFMNFLFFKWECFEIDDDRSSSTPLLDALTLSTTNLTGVGGDRVTATTRISSVWLSVQRLFALVPQSLLFSDVINQILETKKMRL